MNISDGWVLHRPTSSFTSTKSLTRSLESTKMWRQFWKTWPGLVTPIVSQESWLSRLKMLVENLTLFGLFIITWASVPCLDFLILLEPFDHCWAIRWLIQLGHFLGPLFLWSGISEAYLSHSLGRSHQYGRWPEPWEAEVSEDGGAFKLPCFDRTSDDWMLEVKMLSIMYPQGDGGNFRCQYDTRFLSSDKLGHTVCIYSWCLQLLFSVFILQMIVILLHLPEACGGEPIMAEAWRQQGSSSL